MKTFLLTLMCYVLVSVNFLSAQQTYDIRFNLDTVDCEKKEACYMVQIRSANGQPWMLAGQNYRVFYDASKAKYKVGSGQSMLNTDDYSPFTLTTNVPGTDASAFNGLLPFDATLGFLNYSIDLMDLASGGIALDASGEWTTTAMLCFELEENTINNPDECLNLIWARPGLTDAYATAFVEVSEWAGQNNTQNAEADVYDDLDENDGDDACISAKCNIGNPTEISDAACSDGVDNDNDGLVDCADPSCENAAPCEEIEQQFYGIRLSLESLDCETNQACYAVELKSEGRTPFVLGGQKYRLFYNSDIATFVQGVSQMEQNIFTPFNLNENTENVNADGQGDLPFDSDLGFLDYSINLSGFEASTFEVPTNTWIKTSTLCFNISGDAIGDPNSCFNVVWSRDGETDGYSDKVVEIEEFVSITENRAVTGMLYDDLGPDDGNQSCFTTSCGSSENNVAGCSDGIDNDNDGLVDCADDSCNGLTACSTVTTFIGDQVFLDLNGNGIREDGENGINGITISIYLDANQDGAADDPNSPISTTTSASSDGGEAGQYGFSMPDGSYVLIVDNTAGFNITRQNIGTDSSVDSDFSGDNNSSGTITVSGGNRRDDIDLGLFRMAVIAGVAFADGNGDGIQQSNESGIDNIIVNLYEDADQDGEPDNLNEFQTTTTTTTGGEEGGYEFNNLFPGSYIVEFVTGVGFAATTQDAGDNDNLDSDINPSTGRTGTVTVGSGEVVDNIYGGFVTGTSVGDFVWNDTDGDGIRDNDETGINGITVRLYRADGALVSNTVTTTNPTTNQPGFYQFNDLDPGDYYIELVLDSELLVTSAPNVVSDENIDSDITGDNGPNTSSTFSLAQGQVISNLDAGVYNGGSIAGLVWLDELKGATEGVYEEGVDTPQSNVRVKLLDEQGEVVQETTTNEDGVYIFVGLRVGSYSVMFVKPPGNFSYVMANVGNDGTIDSDVQNGNDGTTNLIAITVGQDVTGTNAGLQPGTVPVELISFTGYWNQKADVNTLNWSTASEINNDLFEVERSFDQSLDFRKVGEVSGNGTSNSINDYSFTDENISLSGTYYYRLKQIDYNGDFDYSDVIAIDVNRIGKAYVDILENPISDNLSIELFTEDQAVASLRLYDLNGRLVENLFDNSSVLVRGKNKMNLNTQNMQKGQYILMVKIAEQRFIKKILKL